MELIYTNYFTKDDLRKRGYNLEADDVLDASHFDNLQDAIDDFMDNTLRKIYNMMIPYIGRNMTDSFFSDMANTDLTGVALDYKNRLNRALIEQAIFDYDNGDAQTTSSYDSQKDRASYSSKAIAELWDIIQDLANRR